MWERLKKRIPYDKDGNIIYERTNIVGWIFESALFVIGALITGVIALLVYVV